MKKTNQNKINAFCFLIMTAFIAGFCWLAVYSQDYQKEKWLTESDIETMIQNKINETKEPEPVKLSVEDAHISLLLYGTDQQSLEAQQFLSAANFKKGNK